MVDFLQDHYTSLYLLLFVASPAIKNTVNVLLGIIDAIKGKEQ